MTIDAEDDFAFPNGTILVKNLRLKGRLVGTRHLMRHPDGGWAGYTYEWYAAVGIVARRQCRRYAVD